MVRKKPRVTRVPRVEKKPRTIEDVSGIGKAYFRWRANNKYVDYDHREWGWGHLTCKDFFQILIERLHDYEQTTWDDLAHRQSCHPMPVENIEPDAQERLCEVCSGEIDSLYQIDIIVHDVGFGVIGIEQSFILYGMTQTILFTRFRDIDKKRNSSVYQEKPKP